LDEHLGLRALIERHLTDPRSGRNRQFALSDLFRQSIYSRLAGYEDTNDAERLAVDPTFRMLASRERRETSVALTSTLHWFETEVLTEEDNYQGLRDGIPPSTGAVFCRMSGHSSAGCDSIHCADDLPLLRRCNRVPNNREPLLPEHPRALGVGRRSRVSRETATSSEALRPSRIIACPPRRSLASRRCARGRPRCGSR